METTVEDFTEQCFSYLGDEVCVSGHVFVFAIRRCDVRYRCNIKGRKTVCHATFRMGNGSGIMPFNSTLQSCEI